MFEVKPPLNTQNILSRISEIEIFRYYCPNFRQLNKKFKSEFRKESIPSCIITEYNGKLWYKDFGTDDKALDCFSYVMKKYNLTFTEALLKINSDLNLNLSSSIEPPKLVNTKTTQFNENKLTTIEVENKNWIVSYYNYWKDNYNITLPILDFYNVKPVSKLWINGNPISIKLPTFSFLIDYDIIPRYKIYSPYSKTHKWISNCNNTHIEGYNQLPENGELLIITKSLKDVMVLRTFNINAIAPLSESTVIPEFFINDLKSKFNKIIVFYDNDKAGMTYSLKMCEMYGLERIYIPNNYNTKDISDFVQKYKYNNTKNLLINLLCLK